MTYDQDDVNSLALVAWKEARSERTVGMRGVMHVVVNRVSAVGFPKTIHDVIYQKNAFSSMTLIGDPEFNLQLAADDSFYAYCLQTAPQILNGTDPDNTFGAVWYANEANVTSGWYKTNIIDNPAHPVTAVIGRQTFRK